MAITSDTRGKRGGSAAVWLWLALLVAAGVALAWFGAERVRASTVQVETVRAGTGAPIKAEDLALITYEGRLQDGQVFDSSAGRGPMPISPSQGIIPGFAQALLKMQKGGKYRIQIPSRLAYGDQVPPGGPIPPNANLEFDVEVLQVLPNGALMQMQGMPQGAPPQ